MELDDLKNTWQQLPPQKKTNTDIMEIIQQKSYGPLAALKKAFRKQIVLMFLLPFFLLFANAENMQGALTSILFWCYVAFCIYIIVSAYYNYSIVSKMENMDAMVKPKLEQEIQLLEKRTSWEIASLGVILLFFIILLEVVPYVQHYSMLDKWHSLPVGTRVAAYAVLLLLHFFFSKRIKQRKVGRHLDYLKELLKQMQ